MMIAHGFAQHWLATTRRNSAPVNGIVCARAGLVATAAWFDAAAVAARCSQSVGGGGSSRADGESAYAGVANANCGCLGRSARGRARTGLCTLPLASQRPLVTGDRWRTFVAGARQFTVRMAGVHGEQLVHGNLLWLSGKRWCADGNSYRCRVRWRRRALLLHGHR